MENVTFPKDWSMLVQIRLVVERQLTTCLLYSCHLVSLGECFDGSTFLKNDEGSSTLPPAGA